MSKKQTRPPREWFRFDEVKNLVGVPTADVYVYGDIGGWFDGVDATEFVQTLGGLNVSQINLYVNSGGGDVYDAIAMRNAIARHPATVTATVDGLAASAASFLLTGADQVVMSPNSELMIHDAWGMAIGNAADMHGMGDDLDRVSQNIASMYADKAGGTADDWRQVMLAETWYSAQEAVTAGLADSVAGDDDEPVADPLFDLSRFQYAGRSAAPPPPLERIAAWHAKPSEPPEGFRVPAAHTTDRPIHPEPGSLTRDASQPKEDAVADSATIDAPEAPELNDNNIDHLIAAKVDAGIDRVIASIEAQRVTYQAPAVPPSLMADKPSAKKPLTAAAVTQLVMQMRAGTGPDDVRDQLDRVLVRGTGIQAALTYGTGTTSSIEPQWIDELVAAVAYTPAAYDLVGHDDLQSATVVGWDTTTLPTGGTYAGNSGAVTSNAYAQASRTTAAIRYALVAGLDRISWDLANGANDPSMLGSFLRYAIRDYKKWADKLVIQNVIGTGTGITAPLTAVAAEDAPDGSDIVAAVNQIIDGVVNVFAQGGGLANMAILPEALYATIAKSSWTQAPAFFSLNMSQLTNGNVPGQLAIRPDISGAVAAGDVLVGNGLEGFTAYELPGSPVRVNQQDVANGSIDVGLFGYLAPVRENPNFFSLVSAAA